MPGCGPESACDKVLSSRWGYVFGLPVSAFAAAVYIALLVLLFQKPLKWKVILPLGILVLLSALWFAGLQAFALRAFCKYCMTAHAAGTMAALLLLKNSPLETRSTFVSAAAAAAACAALAIAQFAGKPPAPSVIRTAHSEAIVAPTTATQAQTLTIVNGQITLNLAKVPLSGPIAAPKKLVKLFDYSCHHCRELHHLLHAFRAQHSNELAVVSLPVPLNSDCNPLVKKTPADHVNACDYARIGLAVFYANPAKFDQFSDWLFEPARPPAVTDCKAFAAGLVGSRELEDALNSPAVSEQLSADVNIYTASSRLARSGQLPQMLFEEGGSIGAVSSADQLAKIMAENLGIGSTNTPAH